MLIFITVLHYFPLYLITDADDEFSVEKTAHKNSHQIRPDNFKRKWWAQAFWPPTAGLITF